MSDSHEKVVRLEKKSLKRVLGTPDLFSVGYGDVGSSIYYTLGATALYALGATPLALLIAGLVFICTALTYAEMATTYPEPGGSATFSRYAFNDLISFIAGWGLLLDYIVTLAISAFTIPPYLDQLFVYFGFRSADSTFFHLSLTILIIGFLFIVNLIGIKSSGKMSLILAIFTIATQAGIILLGALLLLNLPHVISQIRIGVAGAAWSPSGIDFLKGCAMAMVAYTGIEAIAQLAAETKHPSISIPKSIKWTIVTVLFLYIGISTVGLSVISPEELGTKYINDPVGGIAVNFPIGGQVLGPWVGLIAAIILLICANAGLIGCSRLIFSMGEFYQVPGVFYKIHQRFRTPYVSLAVFAVLAAAVVLWSRGKMLFLTDLYNFGAQIAFFSAHMSLIILRFKKPEMTRPYRAPFNIPITKKVSIPLTAVIGALATLAVWILVVITKPEGRLLGGAWMAAGLVMYFYYRKKKRISPTAQLEVEKIKVPEYEKMLVENILVAARAFGGTEALQTAYQLANVHGSKVTVVYVLEVPYSMPMDAPLEWREKIAEAALKRAEAISREYNLTVRLELVRARSIESALIRLAEGGSFDLIVVGAILEEVKHKIDFAYQAEKLLKDSPCRVIFCRT